MTMDKIIAKFMLIVIMIIFINEFIILKINQSITFISLDVLKLEFIT